MISHPPCRHNNVMPYVITMMMVVIPTVGGREPRRRHWKETDTVKFWMPHQGRQRAARPERDQPQTIREPGGTEAPYDSPQRHG